MPMEITMLAIGSTTSLTASEKKSITTNHNTRVNLNMARKRAKDRWYGPIDQYIMENFRMILYKEMGSIFGAMAEFTKEIGTKTWCTEMENSSCLMGAFTKVSTFMMKSRVMAYSLGPMAASLTDIGWEVNRMELAYTLTNEVKSILDSGETANC